jgi:threonine dehydratase
VSASPAPLALPSPGAIEEARARIAGIALRTPLVPLNFPESAASIYLKLECLQPIGSFKLRGAANAMAQIPAAELARGVMTASAGNMAQGVAWCARERGIPCTVIVPDTAPRTKVEAVERLGGMVIPVPFETWWETFRTRAYPGVDATFIHAFDDPNVLAGNGTIGLEIIEDLPGTAAVIVPWGGGGLFCGIAAAVRARAPACRLYAAEVDVSAPLTAAWATGAPRDIVHQPSFVDGIGGRTVFPRMWELARPLLDGVLTASLAEVAAAIRRLAERNRVIAEGAGAAPLACALKGGAGEGPIVCIVSGGNIDSGKLASLLRGDIP